MWYLTAPGRRLLVEGAEHVGQDPGALLRIVLAACVRLRTLTAVLRRAVDVSGNPAR